MTLRKPIEQADCPASIFDVRPGQERDAVIRRAFRDDPDFDIADTFPLSFPAEHRFPVSIQFDEAGLVESVRFNSGIPGSVEFERLKIGLFKDDICSVRPDVSYVRYSDSGSGIWRSGSLAESYWTQAETRNDTIDRISFLSQALMKRIAVVEAVEDERRRGAATELARKNRWKITSDPDEMLDAWADVTTCWGSNDDRFKWLVGRLRSATPDEWHSFATQWNWDNGLAPLIWIIKQHDCDRATVTHIYWGLDPEYFAGYGWKKPESGYWDELSYATILDIQDRWERDLYHRSEIHWEKPDYIDRFDLQKLRAPIGMRQTIEGRKLDTKVFWESVPPQFHFE